MLPMPVLPAPVAEAVGVARSLAAAAADRTGPVGAEDRAAWLAGLRQIVDAAEAAFVYTLADFDAAGDGQTLHAAVSTRAWLKGALGMAGGEASERVQLARVCREHLAPAVEGLTDDRRVSFEQVKVIGRACRVLPGSEQQVAEQPEAGVHLTGLAAQLGVDDLRAAGAHLRFVVDPDGSARHAEEDFSRRRLSVAPLPDGMVSLEGVLDAETGQQLTSALAPYLVPSGPGDERTSWQRRADGFADLLGIAVASGGLPTLSGTTVALQVQVPLATLTGHSPAPGRVHSAASATPVWLTPATAGRLACDASVRRLLLDPDGIPLDLGRTVRVFTAGQRQALAARDSGCRFPACSRPAGYTDAHHLTPWAQGGTTDLAGGLLLCRHHHRHVHETGWTIRPASEHGANGTLIFTHPDGHTHASPVPTTPPPTTGGTGTDPPDHAA